MKNIFILLMIVIGVYPMIGQEYDFTENIEIKLIDQEEWSTQFLGIDSLELENIFYNTQCGKLKVKRIADKLEVTFCDDPLTVEFSPDLVVISTASDGKITFRMMDSQPGNPPVSGNEQTNNYQRNIYQDAYILYNGTKEKKEEVINVWGLTSNSNQYLKNIVTLESTEPNRATDKNSGIMGFNATIIADGFAKFLVARVKKELAISFFKGLKSKMNEDTLRDMRALFASSHATLETIDEKIYDYQTYLPAIKQSFEYDLETLPQSLSKVIKDEHSQISKYLNRQSPESRYFITTFLDLGTALKNNQHIGVALAKLSDNSTAQTANKNFLGTIRTLRLFSEALRDTFTSTDKPYWVDASKIDNLIKDDVFFNCFMGLIVEKSKQEKIQFDSGVELATLLDGLHNNVKGLMELVSSYGTITQQINQLNIQQNASKTRDQVRLDYLQYFDLGQNLVGLMEPINRVISGKMDPDKMAYILELSHSIHGIAKGIATKQYSFSILNATNLFSSIDKNNQLKGLLKVLNREAMFIAQVAEANTSDEVAAIIENFAAPVGSWRDKREAKWNVAFDSYVGAGGYWITQPENESTRYGVPTPIGFSLTTPANFISFVGCVVDIGPMVAFRFLDSESKVPDTYLKEIIAPGIFASFNLDKITNRDFLFKLNVGYQQFPLLEKTMTFQNDVGLIKKSGIAASVNVNIPIMTLYNVKSE